MLLAELLEILQGENILGVVYIWEISEACDKRQNLLEFLFTINLIVDQVYECFESWIWACDLWTCTKFALLIVCSVISN